MVSSLLALLPITYMFLFPSIHTTSPTHLVLLYLIILNIFGKEYKS
jgi:hypothetical protein